mmetsp:Transcript_3895/g.11036  ORF Transcript_3895/g.11036 Transcript_3895/m.11036 type:complete len:438 (-) Transcript_3895:76-1389(-)
MNSDKAPIAKRQKLEDGSGIGTDRVEARDVPGPTETSGACSFSDLRPELVAHIAKYVCTTAPDMMNFLYCVGPSVSSVVRKTYLANNQKYLRDTLDLCDRSPKKKARITSWMEFNEQNWKMAALGEECEQNVIDFSFDKSILMEATLLNKIDLIAFVPKGSESDPVVRRFFRCFLRAGDKCLDLPILSSVGDRRVRRQTSAAQVKSLIDEAEVDDDGRISIQCLRWTDTIFCNPMSIITQGLAPALQHLVENNLLDANGFCENASLTEPDDSSGDGNGHTPKIPFLWAAACASPDLDCFRYLLSTDEIDINAIHHLSCSTIHQTSVVSRSPIDALKAVLEHPKVDVDVRDEGQPTALSCLCHISSDKLAHKDKIARMKLLLDAGADPNVSIGDDTLAPIKIAEERLRRTKGVEPSDERDARTRECQEVVDLLCQYMN